MTRAGRAALATMLLGIVMGTSGCIGFVDRGADVLVENQTDQDYVVRLGGNTLVPGTSTEPYRIVPDEVVTIAPANSKRVAYEIPFAGDFSLTRLDVLRRDCTPIYSEPFAEYNGTYVVIDDNANVSIRREFPEKGDPAEPTTACRTIPLASMSPS